MSGDYDPEWNTNGLLPKAADFLLEWGNSQGVAGLKLEVIKEADKSPFIFGELAGNNQSANTIAFYGHFDKQPPMLPWGEGLDPYKPVIRDGKLYGRGAADDGYSFFSTVLVLKALQKLGLKHSRCVLLFEGDEESGQGHVEHYIEKLLPRIGKDVSLILCLDSGTLNYDQMWITTNLRGYVEAKLRVQVLTEGIHSGDGGGLVSSSFRIARHLLDRLEDSRTGEINERFQVEVPANRYSEASETIKEVGEQLLQVPFYKDMQPTYPKDKLLSLYLNRTWKPQLAVTGVDGMPQAQVAGNVLRPYTLLKLSLRIPPRFEASKAAQMLKELLEKDPP